eukprot:10601310-Lingulodinium_polyedra.AAC.1
MFWRAADGGGRSGPEVQMRRWMWTDASPQQKFDWVWAEFDELPVPDLADTFAVVIGIAWDVEGMPEAPVLLSKALDEGVPATWT